MTRHIDRLNCCLILVSCLIAWVMPFGLLVVAYAILGPLHYLTEILWLNNRQYFLPDKRDVQWLSGMTALAICFGLATAWLAQVEIESLAAIAFHTQQVAVTAALLALAIPLILWQFPEAYQRMLAMSLTAVMGSLVYYLVDAYAYFVALGVLLPTLVHVVVFTGAFMLCGALKSKSLWGLGAFAFMILCGAGLLLVDAPTIVTIDASWIAAYQQTLGTVHRVLAGWLSQDHANTTAISAPSSDTGLRVARFLAFAYTYHYLNWFSKTTIIGWHKLNPSARRLVFTCWIACMGIYAVDYTLGLTVVGMLSLLHVFYELPLNWQSLQAIVKFLWPVDSIHRISTRLSYRQVRSAESQ